MSLGGLHPPVPAHDQAFINQQTRDAGERQRLQAAAATAAAGAATAANNAAEAARIASETGETKSNGTNTPPTGAPQPELDPATLMQQLATLTALVQQLQQQHQAPVATKGTPSVPTNIVIPTGGNGPTGPTGGGPTGGPNAGNGPTGVPNVGNGPTGPTGVPNANANANVNAPAPAPPLAAPTAPTGANVVSPTVVIPGNTAATTGVTTNTNNHSAVVCPSSVVLLPLDLRSFRPFLVLPTHSCRHHLWGRSHNFSFVRAE